MAYTVLVEEYPNPMVFLHNNHGFQLSKSKYNFEHQVDDWCREHARETYAITPCKCPVTCSFEVTFISCSDAAFFMYVFGSQIKECI